ncbi:uncharacterized protein BXZ73DRAFT_104440 [Epithele typhae]|uniref:uncharacterized protein n=1 Tax=Epithele typhae TaxID=378194 RepID=UPI002007C5F4|nr:uncharacterized protein BXZ73DRAFT_104440 [Epithele typhae]KAH9921557.1 hypothetical protein BXZ73DRAFT_104440 [Epithele typhae]
MPSIGRVLVLAVLGFSFSARAIPVPAAFTGVEVSGTDDTDHESDAFGLEDTTEVTDEDVDTSDYEVDFQDVDELERRALAKTKAPAGPPAKAPAKTSAKAPVKTSAHCEGSGEDDHEGSCRSCQNFRGSHQGQRMHGEQVQAHIQAGATFLRSRLEEARLRPGGRLVTPAEASGSLDLANFSSNGGATAANGRGVYVSDDKATAIAFANSDARQNKGTLAVLCAIFAKTSSGWRTRGTRKVSLPSTLVGKGVKEASRAQDLKEVAPDVTANNVARLSPPGLKCAQMVLPVDLLAQFTARCVPATAAALPAGSGTFPAFAYGGTALLKSWGIAPAQNCKP